MYSRTLARKLVQLVVHQLPRCRAGGVTRCHLRSWHRVLRLLLVAQPLPRVLVRVRHRRCLQLLLQSRCVLPYARTEVGASHVPVLTRGHDTGKAQGAVCGGGAFCRSRGIAGVVLRSTLLLCRDFCSGCANSFSATELLGFISHAGWHSTVEREGPARVGYRDGGETHKWPHRSVAEAVGRRFSWIPGARTITCICAS